jgi:uncharacterized protein YndB with AHSA1/START domain
MIHAPAARVWHLLTTPSELQRWSGVKIVKAPDGPLQTGDQIIFRTGLGGLIEGRFEVIDLVRLRRLVFEVFLPLGIVNHEVVVITPESDAGCRVTYT